MTARKSPAAKKTSRSTRTKADLEEELQELQERLDGAPELSPQAKTLAQEHVKEVRSATKGVLSVEQIITDGAQFGLKAQRTVADITEQIANKAQELKNLQEAITIEEAELTRLYDLDVASASIKSLVEGHEATKAALELEQVKARQAWAEEVLAHNKAVQARDNELRMNRARAEDEYTYKTTQDRQAKEDEWEQTHRAKQRDQVERHNMIEKSLIERQALITKEEKEIAELKTRIAGLDAEISSKSARDVAIATNSLKKELEGKFALEKKDLEINLRVLEQQKLATDQANEKLAAQVVQLTGQLDAARAQVIEVSNNALASASGQVALTAVRETVKENGQQGGGRKS
jgi:chromosome segregation ATPase